MRVNIEEQGRTQPRFRISETGIGIEEKQLKPYDIEFSPEAADENNEIYAVIQQESEDGKETYIFTIRQKPFRITQTVNGYKTLEINAKDTLFIQDTSSLGPGAEAEPVALGFKFPSKYMYGLPERAANLVLNTTESSEPYYMFNTDRFPHFYQTNVSLYGSLPYLTSHEANVDASAMWMNSAPTWVDLFG